MRIDEMVSFVRGLSAIDRRDLAAVLAAEGEEFPDNTCGSCEIETATYCRSCYDDALRATADDVRTDVIDKLRDAVEAMVEKAAS